MRSSFLVDNGYLDESTFLYGEERILGKQVELAGLREALVCDATYVHDHARGRFSSVDTFERDHRSIVLYFERFRLAGPVGLALLRLCTALGSAEYRIACSIHGFQSGSRRKGTVWWGCMIAVCRNMTSSSRIITEVVAYDVLRQRNRDPELQIARLDACSRSVRRRSRTWITSAWWTMLLRTTSLGISPTRRFTTSRVR